jgi:hypothetical protein
MAMAALSLLKPTLGYRGIVLSVAAVAGLTVVSALWFLERRISAYFLRYDRHVPDDPQSWSSIIAHGGMTALLPLCLLVAVEYSNPRHGALATLIPRLKDEQRRWLPSVENSSEADGTMTVSARGRESQEREVVGGASFLTDLALAEPTPKQEPRVPDKGSQKSSDDSSLATTERVSLDQEGDTPVSTLSKEAPRPLPLAIPSPTELTDRAISDQAVVAEGVGTTPDEAIKDAFRNAVRQVVGAVVDAETLIKDDQVIDDKVLTYSDGFIKTFEEVLGSKKFQGGLHRLKIKAAVERRSVVAKLKAANVAVKEIDGEGLFAEAVTQLEAEGDSVRLIRKKLEGFPQNCVKAFIKEKPEITEKTEDSVTIKYTIEVIPDLDAYRLFAQEMKRTLEKVAKAKGEFTATFKVEGKGPYMEPWYDSGHHLRETISKWIPTAIQATPGNGFTMNKSLAAVALATSSTSTADRIEYTYFMFDNAVRSEILNSAVKAGMCTVTLLSNNNEMIATDCVPLFSGTPWRKEFNTSLMSALGSSGLGVGVHSLDLAQRDDRKQAGLGGIFFISPTFSVYNPFDTLAHRAHLQITRTIRLDLDKLKSVAAITCSVEFK